MKNKTFSFKCFEAAVILIWGNCDWVLPDKVDVSLSQDYQTQY